MKKTFNTIINFLKRIRSNPGSVWVFIILAFLLGLSLHDDESGTITPVKTTDTSSVQEVVTWWTCSMHPQIKLPEPGKCPICFMDLIPMDKNAAVPDEIKLELSPAALKLARIFTSKVRRGKAEKDVFLSGKIAMDETRVKQITAWFPGRLERLFVDYTGTSVEKGEHLAEIYSPELYSAQEELIQAVKAGSGSDPDHRLTLEAARKKLSLLGLSSDQIRSIEKRGKPSDRLTIYCPISGVVIHKNAMEGAYVKTGTPIYTIADLSHVWVVLDAYESDLPWLIYGQNATFSTESIPGQEFSGRVTFIEPVLNEKTRTVKVRINLENPKGLLKPGMFVRAKIHSELDATGKPFNPELAGNWICPMHPEVIRDHKGKCDICGMDLVRAEEQGLVRQPEGGKTSLLIPATAVMQTGKRTLVYIKLPNKETPTFVPREITLGPRAGLDYIVLSGLGEGEEIVSHGNFKIDSAIQIAGKPSMMSGDDSSEQENGSSSMEGMDMKSSSDAASIDPLLQPYYTLQAELAADNFRSAYAAILTLSGRVDSLSETDLKSEMLSSGLTTLKTNLKNVKSISDIETLRVLFSRVSETLIMLEKHVGHSGDETLYELFCPMAFDNKGATWLQTEKTVNNPYFGTKMLRCGDVTATFTGNSGEAGNNGKP